MNEERYYIAYVWGDTRKGDRNGGIMDCETEEEAQKEIEDLMIDHPDATWKLIYGMELRRS